MKNKLGSEHKLEEAAATIFQIATGALAISITFRGSISPADASCKWLLSLAWVSLALVSVSYVFFQLMYARFNMVWEKWEKELTTRIKNGADIGPWPGLTSEDKVTMQQVDYCWKTMLFGFLAGIFLLLTFAVINNQ